MTRRPTRARRAHARILCDALEPRCLLDGSAPLAALAAPPRIMENLGRGVVATRASTTQAFISWRLLALDPAAIAFNVYRSANNAPPVKLNGSPLAAGTNFTDASPNFAANNTYTVRPLIGGVEQPPSAGFTLPANTPATPVALSIPLRNIGGYYVSATWVGDLDGDGEFDFVVCRTPLDAALNPSDVVEAYRRDGTFMWAVDMGPNSANKNNIEPGPSTLMVGNWDGVTVADMDLDGRAEVLIRTAAGVIFGDGAVLPAQANPNTQFISVVNGQTGAERARAQLPADYIADGPLAPALGVGYLDGVKPSLVAKFKNRVGSGAFNMMVVAWDFNGTSLSQRWKFLRGGANLPDGHQIRLVDLDRDGKDEFVDIGFALKSDGTLLYSLAPQGVVHGDRFHIGDLDPDRPGLEGYGVQQDNPSGLLEYYYDAATGQILHKRFAASGTADVGRGIAADIDPTTRGYEYWSFSGIFNSSTPVPGQPPVETQIATEPNRPWPNFRIWWDGDLLSENLNNTRVEKFNHTNDTVARLLSAHNYSATDTWRDAPVFYGDILGDWREEIIYEHFDHSALLVFTTPTPSPHRLYTLPQNPEYRTGMTIHGYYQSHMLDYYLGDGMASPPTPNIAYQGSQPRIVSTVYPAENAAPTGNVTFDTNNAGFNGTSFANFPTTGGALQWNNVSGGDGGFATLRFRFALGAAGARTGRLFINGTPQDITFSSTAAWSAWTYLSLYANLTPGATNTLRLESTGNDLANIDELLVDAPQRLPGDANGDNFVDLGDFDVWLANVGNAASPADFNHDNSTDLGDFDLWFANVGASPTATPLQPTPLQAAPLATAIPQSPALASPSTRQAPDPFLADPRLLPTFARNEDDPSLPSRRRRRFVFTLTHAPIKNP